jgi:hypothetical protein
LPEGPLISVGRNERSSSTLVNMLLVDLSHDRITSALAKVSEVQQVVVAEKTRYKQAAERIGLTTREFDETERRISRGEIKRTTLPVRLDAMAGMHRGRVYAIRDVRVLPNQNAYAVVLDDGKRVYIPAVCGNLSVVRGKALRIAHAPAHRVLAHVPEHRVLARHVSAHGGASAPAPASSDTAVAHAVTPQPEMVATAPMPSSSSHAGFHVPGLGWVAAALGGLAAWWSGGGSTSASDACAP